MDPTSEVHVHEHIHVCLVCTCCVACCVQLTAVLLACLAVYHVHVRTTHNIRILPSLTEICLLFKCRRVASVRAVTVCDLYSLDRTDFDIILKKFPKMKRIMHNAAEERLAQLRDTYGPGWMESEQSQTDINPNSKLLLPRPSRTREYLRRVEASRSALQSSSYSVAATSTQSRSTRSGMSCAVGLQTASSSRVHASSSGSVDIDIPTFTEPENVV